MPFKQDGHPEAPDDLLVEWAAPLPRGRALDLGAGEGAAAAWLAGQGFMVDAVENDPGALRRLRRLAAKGRLSVWAGDIREVFLPRDVYGLVLALAVLHFVPREDLPGVADRITAALRPAGILIARVFVDEGSGARDGAAGPSAEPEPETASVFHPFFPGELRELFPGLRCVAYEEYRWSSHDAPRGFRSGAGLVAQRPGTGGV